MLLFVAFASPAAAVPKGRRERPRITRLEGKNGAPSSATTKATAHRSEPRKVPEANWSSMLVGEQFEIPHAHRNLMHTFHRAGHFFRDGPQTKAKSASRINPTIPRISDANDQFLISTHIQEMIYHARNSHQLRQKGRKPRRAGQSSTSFCASSFAVRGSSSSVGPLNHLAQPKWSSK